MKSIKPGRGPSRRGAAGSVIAIVWGILWTVLAAGATQGAGAFGLIFLCLAFASSVWAFII